jgi:RNA polymerase sigma-70 factor (ECF subfamily)
MKSTFETQVLALLPQLRRYARSLSRNGAEAEDLMQDSLELALRGKPTWRGAGLKTWLTTIMTNAFHNRRRAEPKAQAMIDISDLEVADDTPQSDPMERRRLMLAMEALPADFRSVLMLIVVEGHSYAEVAEILAVPVGTVMSRLSRARRMMTENLRAQNIVPLRGRP